jgi:hypothetical protein
MKDNWERVSRDNCGGSESGGASRWGERQGTVGEEAVFEGMIQTILDVSRKTGMDPLSTVSFIARAPKKVRAVLSRRNAPDFTARPDLLKEVAEYIERKMRER